MPGKRQKMSSCVPEILSFLLSFDSVPVYDDAESVRRRSGQARLHGRRKARSRFRDTSRR